MSVIVKSVIGGSPADKAGIKPGDTLLKIDGNDIMDVLDYRFYQSDSVLKLEYINAAGKLKRSRVRKKEYGELGMEFETYLMDKKHSCRNKCIFCFIDQLPRGLRETLYFKDDDSRLSFLFGNYITLTNITEHEVERIIKMHISPVNISVHTTNPELRVKMMNNKNAGKVLEIIERFNAAGIKINCQLVLVPGYNDGKELERTLSELTALENAECIAAVPVGITAYRQGLAEVTPFDKKTAGETVDIIESFAERCFLRYGRKKVFASDEFYILAERPLPSAEYYEDFAQLENGVGMVPLLLSEVSRAVELNDFVLTEKRKITLATGEAAYPFIKSAVEEISKSQDLLECNVVAIKNNFFGGKITVAGLLTATDIIEQLSGEELGEELLIPAVMLNDGGEKFLDDMTPEELGDRLGCKIVPVANDGFELTDKILGIAQ